MKPRMKSPISKQVHHALVQQLREAFGKYKVKEEEFGKKVQPAECIITEDIRERWTDFLLTLKQLNKIGEDLQEKFGSDASDTHEMLVEKLKEHWCDETAKGNVTLFLPHWQQYEVVDLPPEGDGKDEDTQ